MKRYFLFPMLAVLLYSSGQIDAHCQMPCGIYHDNMVYDQIDQYVETMYKGITVLNTSKFSTVKEKNEFVRWIIQKEKASDEAAQLVTTYFLQQKIKPNEEDTAKRLVSAHKLLFLMVQIKQNTDIKIVEKFADEWEKFKLMFHVEGYECQIEQLKRRKREQEIEKQKNLPKDDKDDIYDFHEHEHAHEHDHDHDHDHPHDHDHDHDHDHSHDNDKKASMHILTKFWKYIGFFE